MLIRPAIGDTDPIRYRRPTPDGQFSGNIIDEAMRPASSADDQDAFFAQDRSWYRRRFLPDALVKTVVIETPAI
jgi:hypothetical protein